MAVTGESDSVLSDSCLVEVRGLGVLIQGPSGSGKSDLVLSLLERDHVFVADDVVVLKERNGRLFGSAHSWVAGLLHVRGVGVVNCEDAGYAMTFSDCPIDVVVRLQKEPLSSERALALDPEFVSIQNCKLPLYRLGGDRRQGADVVELIVRLKSAKARRSGTTDEAA